MRPAMPRGVAAIGRLLGALDSTAASPHRLGRTVTLRKRGRRPGGAKARSET